MYDPGTDTWRPMASMYDPGTDTWRTLASMPVEWLVGSASVVDGRIYLMGGSSRPYPHKPYLSTVWEYDPELAK
jgi:N-acetylneuraminic acid mutarotase